MNPNSPCMGENQKMFKKVIINFNINYIYISKSISY